MNGERENKITVLNPSNNIHNATEAIESFSLVEDLEANFQHRATTAATKK